MIFALYDYLQYRRRAGRYVKDINKSGSLMGRAFDGKIPEKILSLLKPGDIIGIQNFDWWVSWLIMYLTHSGTSHVTFYLGNRTIAHMTPEGLIKEPVESLYKPEARILPPFIRFMTNDMRGEIEPLIDSSKNAVYYDKILVLKKGLYIIFGRDWLLFRWMFLVDITLTFLLLDLLTYPLARYPAFSLLIPVYVLILIVNRILWWKKPIAVSYPEQFLIWLFSTGRGMPLLDVHLSRLESEQEGLENDTA